MFHLLVDDLAHFGSICPDVPDEFNPDSQGYSYIKGKSLINPILELHANINRQITYNEAAYRSHLIIEMIYDLIILDQINRDQSMELLAEAIRITVENRMDEFVETIRWLYGFKEEEIRNVMKKASSYLTAERMNKITNIEGRIRLYADKFGQSANNPSYYYGIKKLFLQARDLLDGDNLFLRETADAIKAHGWLPPVM
jgi:hypothetical protein